MRGKDGRYHLVYKTICLIDGKFYIGKHSTRILEDGYLGSGKHLRRSIKKHGRNNFIREILFYCDSSDDANRREKEVLTDDIRADVQCINIAPGGGGGFISKEHREKFINSSRTSRLKGTQQARDTAKRNAILRKKRGTQKWPHYDWTGKKHKEETKLKMSSAMKDRFNGEKNSQFGTCWVTDGVKPVKIKKEKLNEYLENGYSRGRSKASR